MRSPTDLKLFNSIEVVEAELRKNRAIFWYKVRKNGNVLKYPLIVRVSYNLTNADKHLLRIASSIPAINYLIFTKSLKIDFEIGDLDLRLLEYLSRIATIEVLSNKITAKNKLLKDEFRKTLEGLDYNLRDMVLTIPDIEAEVSESDFNGSAPNEVSDERVVLLVGGGKDSLTSYGLLREAGLEVYPVFINESGRHWLTGKKAFDYISTTDRNTYRIWTTIDRLYAFMNRSLGIVKENYVNIKSDYYPIQDILYPFHVLLSISVALHASAGNIAMGNEYDYPDTFLRVKNGLLIFGGIYDQSFIFERDMSYYLSSLDIRVWSPIRPAPGFLVQKILVKRYPALFNHQISCHSPRVEKGEIKNCGDCKKCRRILLYLLALGADSTKLGFDDRHIVKLAKKLLMGELDFDDVRHIRHSLYLITNSGRNGLGFPRVDDDYEFSEYLHLDELNSPRDYAPRHILERIIPLLLRDAKGYISIKTDLSLDFIFNYSLKREMISR